MNPIITAVRKYASPLINLVVKLIGITNWPATKVISADDKAKIVELLKKDYYIILTRHSNHLSTYMINMSDYFLTKKWGFWSHGLMNFEDQVNGVADFKLLESTAPGVSWDSFETVFGDISSVCLLKPKNVSIDEWTKVLDKARTDVGKPYDTLYDMAQDKRLSCVELVRDALRGEPNYATDFANFEKICQAFGNITPQMFYGCDDFEIAFEVKRG
jgi:hypothetical protein